jgi:hypothetical protein
VETEGIPWSFHGCRCTGLAMQGATMAGVPQFDKINYANPAGFIKNCMI